MQFALNYSPQAAELVRAGQIDIDLFKCPPWIEMTAAAQAVRPVYVHFGLQAGGGRGLVTVGSDRQPADWGEIERWLQTTATGFVNLHLEATAGQHPAIPFASTSSNDAAIVTAAYCRDVMAAVAQFGAERVIVENNHGNNNKAIAAGILPEVIADVVANTGCGFLLDLSHARLAARRLGMDESEYVARLPTGHTREIHLTGLQPFGSPWEERMRANGVDEARIARHQGRWLDHLPLTEADWPVMVWAAAEIRQGKWGRPQIIAVECGGAGPLWQALTDAGALAEQIPRLWAIFGQESGG